MVVEGRLCELWRRGFKRRNNKREDVTAKFTKPTCVGFLFAKVTKADFVGYGNVVLTAGIGKLNCENIPFMKIYVLLTKFTNRTCVWFYNLHIIG
jgi:hypothetical protein